MEEALRALLTGAASIGVLTSSARINWGEHPQGIGTPYIVLTTISDVEGLTMQGPDGMYTGLVQVDCYAPRYAQAKSLARAVRERLHGHRDDNFRLIEHVSARDGREGGTNEAERLHRVSLDFNVYWRA